jgi:hypothetical protein
LTTCSTWSPRNSVRQWALIKINVRATENNTYAYNYLSTWPTRWGSRRERRNITPKSRRPLWAGASVHLILKVCYSLVQDFARAEEVFNVHCPMVINDKNKNFFRTDFNNSKYYSMLCLLIFLSINQSLKQGYKDIVVKIKLHQREATPRNSLDSSNFYHILNFWRVL